MAVIDNQAHWSADMTQAQQMKPRHQPWRLLIAVTTIALGAGLTQTAWARPFDGQGGHGGGHSGHEMGGSTRHMEHLLDEVKATPEQRSQIKQITDATRTDMAAQREASRKLHEQNRSLFAQPTVDARTAETLRQQMVAQHDLMSKRMLQMKLDISRVLSPEQRVLLAERMKNRSEMMQRQRQEREGLDKPRT